MATRGQQIYKIKNMPNRPKLRTTVNNWEKEYDI